MLDMQRSVNGKHRPSLVLGPQCIFVAFSIVYMFFCDTHNLTHGLQACCARSAVSS